MAETKMLKSSKNLPPDEIQRLPLLARSRVMAHILSYTEKEPLREQKNCNRKWAYHEPPKDVLDAQQSTKKRLVESKQKYNVQHMMSEKDAKEKEQYAKLIGQLKAAEARNRLRTLRLRYQANRAQEISHLIACQPIALKAVRLQALVPPHSEIKEKDDTLDKFSRQRVEALLNDMQGLLTNRIN